MRLRRSTLVHYCGIILLLLVLAINAMVSYIAMRRLSLSEGLVEHTQDVLLELEKIESLLKGAETGQRGYLYTNNINYLRPYIDARAEVYFHVDTLQRLTAPDPAYQDYIRELRAHVQARLDELVQTVELHASGQRQRARRVVLSDVGKQEMDEILTLIGQMKQEQTQLQRVHVEQSRASARYAIWTFTIATLIGALATTVFAVVVKREMRQREAAAAFIHAREEWLRTTLMSIADAVIATDPVGRVTLLNCVAEQLTGFSTEQAKGRDIGAIFSLYDEETGTLLDPLVQRAIGQSVLKPAARASLRRSDGHKFLIDSSSAPIRGSNGALIGVVVVFRDITQQMQIEGERQRAQEVVREKQRLLQDIIDNSPAVIYVKDLGGRYLLINRRYEKLFHISREAIVGKTDHDLFPKERADAVRAFDQQVLTVAKVVESEELVAQDDGEHSYISSKAPLYDAAGAPYAICGMSTDITERKRLGEQLREAQKMEAMGRLAGGIAHDFNNLMTIITGYSELLRSELSDRPHLQQKVGEIYKAGEHANSLTRQLLAFSRRQMPQPKLLDLNEVLGNTGNMLRHLLSEDIDLNILSDAASSMIRADRGQIEQMIMNLVINARDAMPEGGRITVAISSVSVNEDQPPPDIGLRSGSYVLLTVTDNGCGMDADTQAHIFEPFFTTKETGKGTGLGLATVYGVVQQSGGHIGLDSHPGSGTTFRVYFPRAEAAAAPATQASFMLPPRGSETILVVEDQDGLRALVGELLQRNGYGVLPARDGREALLLSGKHEGLIDLVVTDVVMPNMGGRELVDALAASRPETKVLYTSGYTDKALVFSPGQDFIEKPFHPDALLRKVREVLDRKVDSLRSA